MKDHHVGVIDKNGKLIYMTNEKYDFCEEWLDNNYNCRVIKNQKHGWINKKEEKLFLVNS